MRTSWALGGATSMSSMERGSPAPQATAAYNSVGIIEAIDRKALTLQVMV